MWLSLENRDSTFLNLWLSQLSNSKANHRHRLLAVLLLCCPGCCGQWCHLPDDFAYAFHHTQLGWELDDICNGCPLDSCGRGGTLGCGEQLGCREGTDGTCGVHVYEDAVWLDEPRQSPRSCFPRIAVGPPPEPYEPPLPPRFLPVPARPVFTTVNLDAATLGRGQVEVGYGPELAFPAGE